MENVISFLEENEASVPTQNQMEKPSSTSTGHGCSVLQLYLLLRLFCSYGLVRVSSISHYLLEL